MGSRPKRDPSQPHIKGKSCQMVWDRRVPCLATPCRADERRRYEVQPVVAGVRVCPGSWGPLGGFHKAPQNIPIPNHTPGISDFSCCRGMWTVAPVNRCWADSLVVSPRMCRELGPRELAGQGVARRGSGPRPGGPGLDCHAQSSGTYARGTRRME